MRRWARCVHAQIRLGTNLQFCRIYAASLFCDRETLLSLLILVSSLKFIYSGGALERGFRRVINNVPVGSLLVQSDSKSGEPLLLHVMLPMCVRKRNEAKGLYLLLSCFTSLSEFGLWLSRKLGVSPRCTGWSFPIENYPRISLYTNTDWYRGRCLHGDSCPP